MAQIETLDIDWNKHSGREVEDFIKSQLRSLLGISNGKVGYMTYVGGNLHLYDKEGEDGIELASVRIAELVYSINLAGTIPANSNVLTTAKSFVVTVTPSTEYGNLGEQMKPLYEDYFWTLYIDNGEGYTEKTTGSSKVGLDISIDIREYLRVGANKVMLVVKGAQSEQTQSVTFNANLTSLIFNPNHNYNKIWHEGSSYVVDGLEIAGNVEKTLHISLNGSEVTTRTLTASQNYTNVPLTITLNQQLFPGTGVQTLELWVTSGNIETDHFNYQIMAVAQADLSTASMVVVNKVVPEVSNFNEQSLFHFTTYGAISVNIEMKAKLNGVVIWEYSQTLATDIGADNDYRYNVEIETNERSGLTFEVNVGVTGGNTEHFTRPLDNTNAFAAITENLAVYINPANRSNGETNRESFVNTVADSRDTEYPAIWTDMSWSNDGWTTDEDGRRCLAIQAGSTVDVPALNLITRADTSACTLEFKFKCDNISDYTLPVLTIADSNTYNPLSGGSNGIYLFPHKLVVLSNNNRVESAQSYPFTEGEVHHVALVWQTDIAAQGGNRRQLHCYFNGVRMFTFSHNDSFGRGSLKIGQHGADFYLYMIRQYDSALQAFDVFTNYLNTFIDDEVLTRKGLRNANAIYNGNAVDFDVVRRLYNCFTIENEQEKIPSLILNNKFNSTVEFLYKDHPEWNVRIDNMPIEGQGTTSMKYYRYNWQSKNTDATIFNYADGTTDVKEGYLAGKPDPELTRATTDYTYSQRGTWKVSRITAKKNVASSPQGHKMGATAMYAEMYKYLNDTIQTEFESGRMAIWQLPFFGFLKKADGSYEFIGLYTVGADKNDKNTAGYKSDYMTIEGPDHDPMGTRFIVPWDENTRYGVDASGDKKKEGLFFGCVGGDVTKGKFAWDLAAYDSRDGHYDTDDKVQQMWRTEFKPAYDIVYYNSLFIMPISQALSLMNVTGNATVEVLNANRAKMSGVKATVKFQDREIQIPLIDFSFYDESYNLVYYNIAQDSYTYLSENHNVVTYQQEFLGSNATPTLEELLEARKKHFHKYGPQYWNVGSATYHSAFRILIGASDNDAKNTYAAKAHAGAKWEWRQDDLDTILATDNKGNSTKRYDIEPHDLTSTGDEIFQGADSALWVLMEEVFYEDTQREDDPTKNYTSVKGQMANLLNALNQSYEDKNLGAKNCKRWNWASNKFERIFCALAYYFWENSAYYFPAMAYAEDAEWTYDFPWRKYIDGQVFNGVTPLSQSLGTQYEAEYQWIYRRLIYIMSKYKLQEFAITSEGIGALGSISITPAAGDFTLSLTPAIAMYPSVQSGVSSVVSGERTNEGETEDITLKLMSGSTDIYIKSADWLNDLGDWSGKALSPRSGGEEINVSINAKRLLRFVCGNANAANVKFNATNLSIVSPTIELIDASNVKTLKGILDLSSCQRIKEGKFAGTNLTEVILPKGARIRAVALPANVASLYLHSLPLLTSDKLTAEGYSNIQKLYFNRCKKLNPVDIIRRIWNSKDRSLNYVTMILDGQVIGQPSDVDFLFDLTIPDKYGYVGEDKSAQAGLPILVGDILIDGNCYERDLVAIHNTFNQLNFDKTGVYYLEIRDYDENLQNALLKYSSDKFGLTEADAEKVTNINASINSAMWNLIADNDWRWFDEWFVNNSTFPTLKGNNNITYFRTNKETISTTWANNNLAQCKTLQHVYFPKLKTILTNGFGQFFDGCSVLEEVDMPELEYIEHTSNNNTVDLNYIFRGCDKITRVNMPKLKDSLKDRSFDLGLAFSNVSNLEELNLNSIEKLALGWSFTSFPVFKTLHLDSVKELGVYNRGIIYSSPVLNEVHLENLEYYKQNGYGYMFPFCTSLETVNLPKLTKSDTFATLFRGCSSLKNINMPELTTCAMTNSGCDTFRYCTSLEEVDLPKLESDIYGDYMFDGDVSLRRVSMPKLTKILRGQQTFNKCMKLTEVNMPALTSMVSSGVFMDCNSLEEINLPALEDLTLGWSYGLFNQSPFIKRVYLGSLKNISASSGANLFTGCSSLEEIDLSSLETLSGDSGGSSMFNGCNSITEILLPKLTSAVSLANMFYNTTLLQTIDISSLQEITGASGMSYAFYNTKALKHLDLSALTTVSGNATDAFRNSNIQTVDFSSLEVIGNCSEMFMDTPNLVSVSFPVLTSDLTASTFAIRSSIQSFEAPLVERISSAYNMFANDTSLQKVDLSSLKVIDGTNSISLFQGCTSLTEMHIDNLQRITGGTTNGQNMFYNTRFPELHLLNLEEVSNMSNFITQNINLTIFEAPRLTYSYTMYGAFAGCTALETVDLQNLETIGYAESIFSGCKSLQTLNLSSLKTLGVEDEIHSFNSAFNGVHIDILELPELTHIYGSADSMFRNTVIDEIRLPKLERIEGNSNFLFAGSIKVIKAPNLRYIKQSEYMFNTNAVIEEINFPLLQFSEEASTLSFINNNEQLKRIILPSITHLTNSISFYNCGKVRYIDFHNLEKITSETNFGFSSNLNYLDISSLKSVVTLNSFIAGTQLEELDLSKLENEYLSASSMCQNCKSLKRVKISPNVKITNMSNMFRGCTSLEEIDINWDNTSLATSLKDIFNAAKGPVELNIELDTNSGWSVKTGDSYYPTGFYNERLQLGRISTNATDISATNKETLQNEILKNVTVTFRGRMYSTADFCMGGSWTSTNYNSVFIHESDNDFLLWSFYQYGHFGNVKIVSDRLILKSVPNGVMSIGGNLDLSESYGSMSIWYSNVYGEIVDFGHIVLESALSNTNSSCLQYYNKYVRFGEEFFSHEWEAPVTIYLFQYVSQWDETCLKESMAKLPYRNEETGLTPNVTIKLHQSAYDKLTEAELELITEKGYTIAI